MSEPRSSEASGRPLLSLVMIVKDEAANIRAVLEAAKPYVDRWTILDTGSTDETRSIILEVMADVPGALHEEPFVDFATSRNRVIELDAPNDSVFNLMLSGDEYLSGGEKLREYLEKQREELAGCYFISLLLDDTQFLSPRILRTGSQWQYEGVVHETTVHPDKDAPKGRVPGLIRHVVSDEEGRLASVWEKHIPLLEAELEERPEHARTLVFLAQSYETLLPYMNPGERKTFAFKAMSMYMRRLDLDKLGTPEDALERTWAMCRYLDCSRVAGAYTDQELYERVKQLREAAPEDAQIALLLVNAAMKVVPASGVYELARSAALAGEKVLEVEHTAPVSLSIAWKAHLIAAKAAQLLASKYPDLDTGGGLTYSDRVREHVSCGTACGGPWAAFESLGGSVEMETT